MKEIKYNRNAVYEYAEKWAFKRNPKYYNYDFLGGDCTNFVSQCIYAGCYVMNYIKNYGWYYINSNSKSPSWTGVEFLYNFLIKNKGVGPYGEEIQKENIDCLQVGDIIQLSFNGNIYGHTLVVVNIEKGLGIEGIKIASHTYDSFNKSVSEYDYKKIRYIHINKVRKY